MQFLVPPVPESITAEAGVVFCEGPGKEYGVDRSTHARLNFAADLYKKSRIKNIIAVGCTRPRFKHFGGRGMKRTLIDLEIPEEAVFHDSSSYETISNWIEAEKIIGEHGWKKIALISSPMHLLRIQYIVKQHNRQEFKIVLFPCMEAVGLQNFLSKWKRIHHAWLAWGAMLLLPDNWYLNIMKWIRL